MLLRSFVPRGHGDPTDKVSLEAKARELARKAAEASSRRAADTVSGGHEKRMRQTVIALRAGTELAEHQNPGEPTRRSC